MCSRLRTILLIATLLAGNNLFAEQFAYIVRFTDKDNSPYSISSPSAFLSPRAISRRAAQGISIDVTDIPVNQTYVDTVLLLTGGKLHGTSRWLNMCVILIEDSVDIHNIDSKPYVASTQFVAYYTGMLHREPIGNTGHEHQYTGNKKTWGSAEYGNTWPQTAMVRGNELHDDGYTGNGKLIAVLDAGFTDVDTHPGFSAMWVGARMVDKRNFTLASDDVFAYDTHGTRALSTMAGYVPGTYIGSAPMASYALYITEDGNSEQPIELTNMVFATERADSLGADVVTTSLGYNEFDNGVGNFVFATDFDGKTTLVAQAANIATQKGILFVASAGNEGGGSWNMVLTPGDADSALTVGSVDYAGISAFNSGYGPNAAGRVKPDVVGMGVAAALFVGSGYGNQNGTSFSTPQIAGYAACLLQAFPSATPFQVREAIVRCASRYSAPTTQQGYGIPNFFCAEHMILDVDDDIVKFAPTTWVSAAPNPVNNVVNLIVAADEDQEVDFSILDVSGRVVVVAKRFFTRGYNPAFTIELGNLPTGIYMLRAVSPTQQQVLRLEKR